jgi:hypothetical protein
MSDHRGEWAPRSPIHGFIAVLAVFAFLTVIATAASAADKLTIATAREKAAAFAERTCKRDESCVRSGVLNCRREAQRVVHCRIFDDRDTEAQGNYRCNREIRMVMNPDTHRVPVTGLGRWHC